VQTTPAAAVQKPAGAAAEWSTDPLPKTDAAPSTSPSEGSVEQWGKWMADRLRQVPNIQLYDALRLIDLADKGPAPARAVWQTAQAVLTKDYGAVTVGDLVRLFTFQKGNSNLVELTLPEESPYVGRPVGEIAWPENTALVTILRDGMVYLPNADQPIEAGDELLFVAGAEIEQDLQKLLAPHEGD